MNILQGMAGAIAAGSLVITAWISTSLVYFPLTAVDFEKGKKLFENRCATCHAVDNRSQGGSYGPNLSRIGAVAAGRVPNMSAEEYLLESIVRPDAYRKPGEHSIMPADIGADLRREDILSLVGFLMTRGGSANGRRLLRLLHEIDVPQATAAPPIDLAQVEAGKQLYFGKGGCANCHVLRDVPGHDLRAPSLFHVGDHSPEYLRAEICEPGRNIAPAYAVWTAWLESGKSVTGRLLRQSEDGIELLSDSAGRLSVVSIAACELEHDDDGLPLLQVSPKSAMPDGLKNSLSDVEIDQLVTFLKTLR